MRRQRNTRSSERERNTKLQLQLVPRSQNERAKQSSHQQAVVAVRLPGATIAMLDKIVERDGRYRFTRSRAIKEAIADYIIAKKGNE